MKTFLTLWLVLSVHLLWAQTVSFSPAPTDLPPTFQELDLINEMIFFDADRDGDKDLLVSGSFPRFTKLFINDGEGVFSEKESGVPFSQGGYYLDKLNHFRLFVNCAHAAFWYFTTGLVRSIP